MFGTTCLHLRNIWRNCESKGKRSYFNVSRLTHIFNGLKSKKVKKYSILLSHCILKYFPNNYNLEKRFKSYIFSEFCTNSCPTNTWKMKRKLEWGTPDNFQNFWEDIARNIIVQLWMDKTRFFFIWYYSYLCTNNYFKIQI